MKQDASSDTVNRADTQQRRDWTAAELALLEDFAEGSARSAELALAFPDRSLGAVKLQLCKLRRELGIAKRGTTVQEKRSATTMLDKDDPGLSDDWLVCFRRAAVASNADYLAALMHAA